MPANVLEASAGRVDTVNGQMVHTRLFAGTLLPEKATNALLNGLRSLVRKWRVDGKYAYPTALRYEAEKLLVRIQQSNLIVEQKSIIPNSSAMIGEHPSLLPVVKNRRTSKDSNDKHISHKAGRTGARF